MKRGFMITKRFRSFLQLMLFAVVALPSSWPTYGDSPPQHPGVKVHGYTESQILSMFDRPADVPGLLANLKLAADERLLWEPAFYEDATLLKFFDGVAVERKRIERKNSAVEDIAIVSIADPRFPGMTVQVVRGRDPFVDTSKVPRVYRIYFKRYVDVSVHVIAVPEFTVCAVRDIFGPETFSRLDDGFATDGATYVPQVKGSLGYKYPGGSVGPTGLRIEQVTFDIRLEPANAEYGWPSFRQQNSIHNRDQIQSITLFDPEP
jgi:hypothetical protein